MGDLDKDGIWDELFFQVDIEANSTKTIYIYLGENIRGWNKHFTHANIGSYCPHQMPFWESENVGWKIWFANCCDVYAKRKPVLMSNHLYMDNLDGYGVSVLNHDRVSFLHNLSDVQHEHSLGYHYVRFENGTWKHTRITDSNHHWNSGHLVKSADGVLHAYVISGEGYFDSDGYMDRYGGGNIEEWTSTNRGNTWEMARDLTPDKTVYPGWKYNNIQPVKKPDGTLVDGMLLFYGWKDKDAPQARAFLLHSDGDN